MSKVSFRISGDIGAPSVDVELEVSDYYFGDGTQTLGGIDFMHTISQEVERVISNRLRAMHQQYRRGIQLKQEEQERELAKGLEITALEDRLADLKGEVQTSPTAPLR